MQGPWDFLQNLSSHKVLNFFRVIVVGDEGGGGGGGGGHGVTAVK